MASFSQGTKMVCLGCNDSETSHSCGTWGEDSPGGQGLQQNLSVSLLRHLTPECTEPAQSCNLAPLPANWLRTSAAHYIYNRGKCESPLRKQHKLLSVLPLRTRGSTQKETKKRLKNLTESKGQRQTTQEGHPNAGVRIGQIYNQPGDSRRQGW